MLEPVKNLKFNDSDKIKDLADNIQRYVRVTEHNVATIYDYFCRNVIKNVKKIKSHNLVAIFIGVITDGANYYVHPKKPNYICTPFGEIQIEASQYKGFISHFNRTYTPQEKMKFAEISDRLIEDTDRRNKGEFYTPTLFVDYAHKMISEALGDNWKDEYVVWDNCCGTKNLTRDYRFKELYCSTLENAELEISKKYNPEAVSFQFDFLNDDLDKLPKGLLEAFEKNKKIVFFLNPPYGTSANLKKDNKGEGMAKTKINEIMVDNNMGKASANLYAQFLYRILLIKQQYNLTNCYIALFCNPGFISTAAYLKFREKFLTEFNYKDGILFNASEFADVSDAWGITFNIWGNGEQQDKHIFKHKIVTNNSEIISVIGSKNLYNIDNLNSGANWYKKDIKELKLKSVDAPNMVSGIKVTEGPKNQKFNKPGKLLPNALGYFYSNSNNIMESAGYCSLLSSVMSHGVGSSILPINFNKCCTMFSVRKIVEGNWINSKDEYLAPNEQHEKYNEFVNDSLIYSLFHSSSNQSSLRNVDYKEKKWDIKNEFFWLSNKEIENLSNTNGFTQTYNDARTSKERYVYNKLQTITLSPEAQDVLNKASDIVRNTFKYRELFNQEHPEYQIMNFDCGWYQIKALAKEYAKSDYEEFVKLYKKLADKMRPMVYTLGFLR